MRGLELIIEEERPRFTTTTSWDEPSEQMMLQHYKQQTERALRETNIREERARMAHERAKKLQEQEHVHPATITWAAKHFHEQAAAMSEANRKTLTSLEAFSKASERLITSRLASDEKALKLKGIDQTQQLIDYEKSVKQRLESSTGYVEDYSLPTDWLEDFTVPEQKKSRMPKAVAATVAALGLYALSQAASAQDPEQTRLGVLLDDPDGQGAKGRIEIAGKDTTITDNNYDGSNTYILKTIQTGIEEQALKDIRLAPNPTIDGHVRVLVESQAPGTMEAYNTLGVLLDKAQLPYDNDLSFTTKPGIVLLRYTSQTGEQELLKLVTLTDEVNIAMQQEARRTLKAAASDDYSVEYNDPTSNLEGKRWDVTIEAGEEYTISETLSWSVKNDTLAIDVNGGLQASINEPERQEATLVSGQATITYDERYDANKPRTYNVKITGSEWSLPETFNGTMSPNATTRIQGALLHAYLANGTAWGIDTLDFIDEEKKDTLASATITAGSYDIAFERRTTSVNAAVHARGGGVHKTFERTLTPGMNSHDFDISTILNNFWIHGTGTSSNGGTLAGVDVQAYKDGAALMEGTSGADGTYETSHIQREEETLSLDSVVYKLTGYNPLNTGSVTISKDGWRKDVALSPAAVAQSIWLYDGNSTPAGTSIRIWDDGSVVMSATIDASGDYLTNTIDRVLPFIADSLVATAPGYNKLKEANISWAATGGKQREIDLTPTTNPPETFYIDAGTTTRNATIIIKDGTTTITTLTADGNGYVSATSIDHQLEDGKDLVLQYSAPNADAENITKIDVDDEEHVNIAYLLNTHFNFNITADSEANWNLNEQTGTGNGSASLETRANSLAYTLTASATSAENFSKTGSALPGTTAETIVMNWIYTINMTNTEDGSAITGSFNASQAYTATGNGSTVQRTFTRTGVKSGTLNVAQTKTGYNPTSQDFPVSKGTSNVTLEDMTPTTDPLETFYAAAGTTSRNATLTFKEGTVTIGTLTSDASGHVNAASFDWQLQSTGKDITITYVAANTDSETITKYDVDDGETINIDYILNTYFSFNITADAEASWNINGQTGTGNGNASLEARANSLAYTLSATAPSAENFSTSGNALPGTTAESIVMNWIYTVNMTNTENGSAITGSFNGTQKYTATGNDGTVQKTFTMSGVKSGTLRIQQTKTNYTSSDQSITASKGTTNITLDELLGKYTLVVNSTVTGTSANWDLNGSFADSETGSGTLTLYKELDADAATSDLTLTASGYQNWTDNRTVYPGTTSMTANQQPEINPLETFYIDAGTTTRNATIVIKDGGTTIGTLTADGNGYVSATSIDHQLEDGLDLTFQYSAANADPENITKTDVDDEEHVSIAYLLNAHFPITITADSEANWSATSSAGTNTGTGNGSFTQNARTNSLSFSFSATAISAENYSSSASFNPGGGSHNITMNWIYTVEMFNTEEGSWIIGTFNGSQAYTTTGTGGTVQKTFTRSGVKSGTLTIGQTKTGYEPTSNTKTVNKGSNDITLDDMIPQMVSIRFRGYSSSPTGTVLNFIEGGSTVMTGTVDGNGDYTTGYYSVASVPFTIDQVVADGPSGYIDETHNNIVANAGDNTYEVNLEEEQQGQEYTFSGRVISINGSDFISGTGVLRFETPYGTYYANSSGGNFSVTVTADPDQNVAISGNASGYESNFISVVGYDSKTGSGPASVDPDNLDDGTLDIIVGRSDIVNNPTWQATQNDPGGFYRGGTLDLEVYDWNEETQAPAGEMFTSAQSTALSYVPGACNFGIYGSVVHFSGSPTIISGAPTSSSGKVLSYTDTRFSYFNSPNPGMDGTVVVVGGTNVTSTFIEAMEWLTGQGGEGYFFSGTSMTEAGKAKIVYTTKFGY